MSEDDVASSLPLQALPSKHQEKPLTTDSTLVQRTSASSDIDKNGPFRSAGDLIFPRNGTARLGSRFHPFLGLKVRRSWRNRINLTLPFHPSRRRRPARLP